MDTSMIAIDEVTAVTVPTTPASAETAVSLPLPTVNNVTPCCEPGCCEDDICEPGCC